MHRIYLGVQILGFFLGFEDRRISLPLNQVVHPAEVRGTQAAVADLKSVSASGRSSYDLSTFWYHRWNVFFVLLPCLLFRV